MHARAAGPTESFVVTDDGCRLWTARHETANATPDVAQAGPDSAAILCHGGPGFWDTLAPIAELLAERGPAIRWDQRGGGRSQHQGPYTLLRFTADLDAVRSAHQVDRPVLVGHSWGASLALQYFLTHPDRVRALIYIAGTGLSWDWRPQHNAACARALAPVAAKFAALRALPRPTAGQRREEDFIRLLTEFSDPGAARGHVERLLSPYFVSDPAVNQALNAEMRALAEADLIERCRALPERVPVLIVDGALDPRPRWAVDALAAALPNVRRVTLTAAGHLPWLDSPAEFAAAIREFVP
ncbi:MAG TPA: alpha/beta hydrolase [Actinocrinis sp.]|nr:alpha/beta hydrolase [Actinocrinis sp.]